MKFITELHNKHKGEPVWIAGSDPTLADYPDDFLDGKLSITLHLAYLKFPKATYRYFNERDRLLFLKEKHPGILDQDNIFGWPFYNRSVAACEKVVEDTNKGYYLDLKPYPPNGNPSAIFSDLGPTAMREMVTGAANATRKTFGGHGTCLHPCMYVAIMMGCNPINIIGCGFGAAEGKEHFGEANAIDHKMRPQTPSFSGYRGTRMTRGLNAIIEGCKDTGIKVNWIKGYDKPIVHLDKNPKEEGLPKKVS